MLALFMPNLASFLKYEACGQTVLPVTSVKSISIRQKLIENAKIQMRHFE